MVLDDLGDQAIEPAPCRRQGEQYCRTLVGAREALLDGAQLALDPTESLEQLVAISGGMTHVGYPTRVRPARKDLTLASVLTSCGIIPLYRRGNVPTIVACEAFRAPRSSHRPEDATAGRPDRRSERPPLTGGRKAPRGRARLFGRPVPRVSHRARRTAAGGGGGTSGGVRPQRSRSRAAPQLVRRWQPRRRLLACSCRPSARWSCRARPCSGPTWPAAPRALWASRQDRRRTCGRSPRACSSGARPRASSRASAASACSCCASWP